MSELSTGVISDIAGHSLVLDYDASNNPIYIGKAATGAAKSAAAWRICKLTFDVNNNVTDVQFANGLPTYDQIWNNRAALSYS